MTELSSLPMLATVPAALCGGILIGMLYFRALRATVDLILTSGLPMRALALSLGRVALLGAGFYAAALAGAPALLAALAGVMVAKSVLVRPARRVAR